MASAAATVVIVLAILCVIGLVYITIVSIKKSKEEATSTGSTASTGGSTAGTTGGSTSSTGGSSTTTGATTTGGTETNTSSNPKSGTLLADYVNMDRARSFIKAVLPMMACTTGGFNKSDPFSPKQFLTLDGFWAYMACMFEPHIVLGDATVDDTRPEHTNIKQMIGELNSGKLETDVVKLFNDAECSYPPLTLNFEPKGTVLSNITSRTEFDRLMTLNN